MMLESPELRWAFIRKIYSIICIQLLATIAVAATVVSVRPISHFFVSTGAGLALYIVLIITPFIGMQLISDMGFFFLMGFGGLSIDLGFSLFSVLCPLYYYYQKHPVNYLLLGIFTISLSFAVGLTCAFTSGKIFLLSDALSSKSLYFSNTGNFLWLKEKRLC